MGACCVLKKKRVHNSDFRVVGMRASRQIDRDDTSNRRAIA